MRGENNIRRCSGGDGGAVRPAMTHQVQGRKKDGVSACVSYKKHTMKTAGSGKQACGRTHKVHRRRGRGGGEEGQVSNSHEPYLS